MTDKYHFVFVMPLEQRLDPIMEASIVKLEFNRYRDNEGDYIALTMWDAENYGHFCPPKKVQELINKFSLNNSINEWFKDSPY